MQHKNTLYFSKRVIWARSACHKVANPCTKSLRRGNRFRLFFVSKMKSSSCRIISNKSALDIKICLSIAKQVLKFERPEKAPEKVGVRHNFKIIFFVLLGILLAMCRKRGGTTEGQRVWEEGRDTAAVVAV